MVVGRENFAPAYNPIGEKFVRVHELLVEKPEVESTVMSVYWNCTFYKRLKYELSVARNLKDFPKMPKRTEEIKTTGRSSLSGQHSCCKLWINK